MLSLIPKPDGVTEKRVLNIFIELKNMATSKLIFAPKELKVENIIITEDNIKITHQLINNIKLRKSLRI